MLLSRRNLEPDSLFDKQCTVRIDFDKSKRDFD